MKCKPSPSHYRTKKQNYFTSITN